MKLRENLPPLPERIRSLPVSDSGYPIPYFVANVDGKPDFRVMDPSKRKRCITNNLCWICGTSLGRHKAFSGGPLLSVSQISAEPPSHRDCAVFAAQSCPYMLLPRAKRRDVDMPLEVEMVDRNPGATLVWVTDNFKLHERGSGQIWQIGKPSQVIWFAEGIEATRSIAIDALEGSVDAAKTRMQELDPLQVEKLNKNAALAAAYLPK